MFRLLAASLSGGVLLGVAEITLRVWSAAESRRHLERDPDWKDAEALHRRSADPELVYELIPNKATQRHGVEVVTNSAGFRDHEFPKPGSARRPRIVVLGDSVAWGWGVPMDRAFPQLLEERLARRSLTAGEGPVVYNLGVDGYSTRKEIRLLETVGLALDPDLILVAYVLNDPDERVGVLRLPADGGLGAHFAGGTTSELLNAVQGAWARLRDRFGSAEKARFVPDEYHHQVHQSGRERIRSYFHRLGKLSQAHDVPVLIAVVPVFDFSARGPYPWESIHQEVTEMAAEVGLVSVDLYEAFRGVASVPFAHNVWHPNARGHAVIADALAPRLRRLLSRELDFEPPAGR